MSCSKYLLIFIFSICTFEAHANCYFWGGNREYSERAAWGGNGGWWGGGNTDWYGKTGLSNDRYESRYHYYCYRHRSECCNRNYFVREEGVPGGGLYIDLQR